ncbi:Apoptosis inhibitor 5-like protein API5 [Vitis vinifera]|uniref:Apoptosis inhibitor 5-like protein API5 n=1 Tax=Vitis vinifera TaxID=29760 RepID=A0A438IH75_VITVI|nr:Apoptosis inhibitor 5-like protein API5 [Vitis vinifera]
METLSCLLKRVMSSGFLLGCRVRGKGDIGVPISHLFADDTLVFYGVHRIMTYLSRLLIWLKAILRLRINLDKSELLLMERVENLDDFTLEFSCKVGQIEVRAYLERLSLEQGWSCSKAPLSKVAHRLGILKSCLCSFLTGLFKHIMTVDDPSTDENLREKVLNFIRDKVFPLKAELLKPQEQMERHITNLIKKSLEDVTGAEFKMFMDFLRSLTLFGEKAPPERVQELIEIIEGQADLDAQFNVP